MQPSIFHTVISILSFLPLKCTTYILDPDNIISINCGKARATACRAAKCPGNSMSKTPKSTTKCGNPEFLFQEQETHGNRPGPSCSRGVYMTVFTHSDIFGA